MSQNSRLRETGQGFALDDLARRREELRIEIRHQRRDLLGLVIELRHVDEAIQQAAMPAEAAPAASDLAGRLITDAGGISQLVIEAFGDTAQMLTSRTIAQRVSARLGLDTADGDIMKYMTQRVCTCLWTMKQTGAVTKQAKTPGRLQQWALCASR
jgi:hypothetical protein